MAGETRAFQRALAGLHAAISEVEKKRVTPTLALVIALAASGCGSTASTVTKTVTRTRPGSSAHAASSSATVTAGKLRTYRVPSAAMVPTLSVGQMVIVSLNPNYNPVTGDIVVFHPPAGADPATPICGKPDQGAGRSAVCTTPTPQESSETFIKRIVAGPGDTISMRNGHVIRNGVEEQEAKYTEPCGSDSSCTFPTPVTIPTGDYFVLGDNRGASDDSRFWGPVRRAWIIGKVVR